EDRITGIPRLLQLKPTTDVVLLDDAYQHRSVKPGINILITDFSKPFYNDYILPYGSLRESKKAYERADMIIVSKCPHHLTEEKAAEITNRIHPFAKQKIFFTTLRYHAAYDLFSKETIALNEKHILIVCGIAKPEQLIGYVSEQARDIHTLSYPDHHYFVSKDLEEIKETYQNWNVPDKLILTTEKDAARL